MRTVLNSYPQEGLVRVAIVGKIQWELTGFSGAPGINTWFARAGVPSDDPWEEFNSQIRAFYQNMRTYMAPGLTVSSIPVLRLYDDESGTLLEAGGLGAQSPVVSGAGAGSGDVSRATMAKLQFVTDAIRKNRVLRGGIYFGPIASVALTGDGQIGSGFIAAVDEAVGGMLDVLNTRLVVWGQPQRDPVTDAITEPGMTGFVQHVGVMAAPAVLRSRRD